MHPGPIPTLVAGGYLGETSSFCIGHRSAYRVHVGIGYGIGVGISFLGGFAGDRGFLIFLPNRRRRAVTFLARS